MNQTLQSAATYALYVSSCVEHLSTCTSLRMKILNLDQTVQNRSLYREITQLHNTCTAHLQSKQHTTLIHYANTVLYSLYITKTCLYKFGPLQPHFYIVKLGFTGVYIIFLILPNNIDCRYLLEPPRRGGSNEYPQSMF